MDKVLMRIAVAWGKRVFGNEHMTNPRVRAVRLAEEVAELAQAVGVPRAQLLKIVDVVYARPVGEPVQEIGGVMICLTAICFALGVDPDTAFETEVQRVLAEPVEDFKKRNDDKLKLGLTG